MQNSYTTPEQSERLINLGLPIDTADCIYRGSLIGTCIVPFHLTFSQYKKLIVEKTSSTKSAPITIPSWSAGRLIELLFILCKGRKNNDVTIEEYGYEQGIIESLVRSFEIVDDKWDFSKLDFKLEAVEEEVKEDEDKPKNGFIVTHDCYIGSDPYTGEKFCDTDIIAIFKTLESAQNFINEQIKRNIAANLKDLWSDHFKYRTVWPEFFDGQCAHVFMENDDKKWMWEYNIFERSIYTK